MPVRSSVRWLERFLWAAGLLLLGWVGYVWAEGQVYQHRAEARLEQAIADTERRLATPPAALPGDRGFAVADGTEPAAPEGETGSASDSERDDPTAPAGVARPRTAAAAVGGAEIVGRLEVPRLGLSVMVGEGVTPRVLRRGAGHLPSTPLPGTPGNTAFAGHRDRHFRPLEGILPGDDIVFTGVDGTFRYRVQWTSVVQPEDVDVLDPTDEPVLTLVTCYPFYFVGDAPERFIVRARQVGREPSKTAGAG